MQLLQILLNLLMVFQNTLIRSSSRARNLFRNHFSGIIAREATEENSGEAFDEPDIDDREGFVTVN